MLITTMLVPLLSIAISQAEPPRRTVSFSLVTKTTKRACMAGGETEDGARVYFGIGIANDAFSVTVVRPRWDIVDDKDTDRSDIPVTVKFADGTTMSSPFGGYFSGAEQGVWGTWRGKDEGGKESVAAFEMVRTNDRAEVLIDGKKIAEVSFGAQGMTYSWIKKCLIDERAKREI